MRQNDLESELGRPRRANSRDAVSSRRGILSTNSCSAGLAQPSRQIGRFIAVSHGGGD
jgi:hypothetical protein